MGAVPDFCGVTSRSFIVRKHLGQPPMGLGTVPSLLQKNTETWSLNVFTPYFDQY